MLVAAKKVSEQEEDVNIIVIIILVLPRLDIPLYSLLRLLLLSKLNGKLVVNIFYPSSSHCASSSSLSPLLLLLLDRHIGSLIRKMCVRNDYIKGRSNVRKKLIGSGRLKNTSYRAADRSRYLAEDLDHDLLLDILSLFSLGNTHYPSSPKCL